jgi:hypothetical protein
MDGAFAPRALPGAQAKRPDPEIRIGPLLLWPAGHCKVGSFPVDGINSVRKDRRLNPVSISANIVGLQTTY